MIENKDAILIKAKTWFRETIVINQNDRGQLRYISEAENPSGNFKSFLNKILMSLISTHFERLKMYKRLPTTRELSQLLKPEKKLDTVAKFNKILSIIMICGITIVALAWFLIEWNLASKKITGYVAISSIGIVFVTWIISIIIDAIQSIGMFSNPDRELADQLDDGMDVERELVASFRAIPLHILLARHNRLEQQLLVWEKWLDVARLIGLLGPPLVLIGKEYLGTIGTLRIESLMAATFVGMLLGAIFIRSGMRRLQRVSYLLKRASERSSFRPNNRERRKRR